MTTLQLERELEAVWPHGAFKQEKRGMVALQGSRDEAVGHGDQVFGPTRVACLRAALYLVVQLKVGGSK